MHDEAFKRGFIKRAKECGLSDKHAEELIKEAFAPLVPLLATGARFAAPRILPFLGRMLGGMGRFASRMWSGNVGSAAQPMYNLGANGAAKLGLKGMLNSPIAKGVGYGMLGNEAMNQLSAPPQTTSPQLEEAQYNPGPQQNWVNPFTSSMNRNGM